MGEARDAGVRLRVLHRPADPITELRALVDEDAAYEMRKRYG